MLRPPSIADEDMPTVTVRRNSFPQAQGENKSEDGFDGASSTVSAGEESSSVPGPSFRDRVRQIGTAINMLRNYSFSSSDGRQSFFGTSSADKADFRLGISRSMRAYNLFEELRVDYLKTLEGFSENSQDWESIMQALHTRSARKCLGLARANGGLYIKVAPPSPVSRHTRRASTHPIQTSRDPPLPFSSRIQAHGGANLCMTGPSSSTNKPDCAMRFSGREG